nr:PilW family protein [Halomonas utahensis]
MGQEIDIAAGGGNNIPLNAASGIPQGTTIELIGPDCSNGFRFIKGNNENASAISVAGAGLGNQGGANINNNSVNNQSSSVHVFRSTLYYVGENPNGEPSLYRQTLNNPGNGIPSPQELVAGVENMQVLYGIGNEGGATEYITANDVAPDEWSDIVSVRLGFVMASAPRTRKTKETRTFNLLGMKTQSPEDKRVRVIATKTVAFRNRLE